MISLQSRSERAQSLTNGRTHANFYCFKCQVLCDLDFERSFYAITIYGEPKTLIFNMLINLVSLGISLSRSQAEGL